MNGSTLWFLLCFVVLFLLILQLALPAQAPEPSLRTTTTEVLLDFVVRDKSARIIRDLRPEELQVLEDGAPQAVRHFELVHGNSTAVEPPQKTTATPAGTPGAAPSAVPETVNRLRDISELSLVNANLDPRGRQL